MIYVPNAKKSSNKNCKYFFNAMNYLKYMIYLKKNKKKQNLYKLNKLLSRFLKQTVDFVVELNC